MNGNHNTTLLAQELQQQQANKTQKKKCRGNRKKQRYRRQLYALSKTSEEVEKLVQEQFPSQIQQQQQQQQQVNQEILQKYGIEQICIPLHRITLPERNSPTSQDSIEMNIKRKRFVLTPTPTSETVSILDKSFSQLSISQGNSKKKKTITTTTNDQIENNELLMNSTEKYKPRYLKVSDRVFKQMLSNTINNGTKPVIQCLNTPEKLHLVRKVTELTNNLCFQGLERQLWKEYHDLSSKDNNWQLKITKGYAHQHNTCRMYRPQKSYIEQRQKTIEHQLQQTGNELRENLIKLQQITTQWEPSIDFEILSNAINECVKNGQQRLKQEFDYKKQMISLDWNDHQLITKFDKLKPSEELIELAKQIWQTTANKLQTTEQIEILRQRIILKRLPTKTDQMINQLLHGDDDDKRKTHIDSFLDENQRASFTSRSSKTIVQCKFNLILIDIDEFETVLRHHHATLIHLQDKLSKLNKEKPHVYTTLLLDTIEQRRQAMKQRFFRIREYKLKTFFDEAPTVVDNIL